MTTDQQIDQAKLNFSKWVEEKYLNTLSFNEAMRFVKLGMLLVIPKKPAVPFFSVEFDKETAVDIKKFSGESKPSAH